MIKYEIYAIYNILFSDNPFFKEVIAYVYCGLTDEEALRLIIQFENIFTRLIPL